MTRPVQSGAGFGGDARDWKAIGVVAAILLAAAALRLYRIGSESIWMDEAFTLRDTHWPPNGPNLYRPVYYVALWLWMRVGESDAWARCLAALFGVANVWASYRLGREAAGRAVGLVAGAACALSPLEINHSQEIRMYTAASFLGVMGSLAALRLGRGASWWRWTAWALCRAVAVLTSSFEALLLIGDALLLKRSPRTRTLGALLAGGLTAASLVVLANSKMVNSIVSWTTIIPPITPRSLVRPLVSFAAWWPTAIPVAWPTLPGPFSASLYAALGVVVVVLLGLALFHPGLSEVRPLVGWAAAPLAVLVAASVAVAPLSLWLERYVLCAGPYVLVLSAAALVFAWRAYRPFAVLAVVLYLAVVGQALAFYYHGHHRTDWRGAAAAVRAESRPRDSVVVSHSAGYEAIAHYLSPERAVTALTLAPDAHPDRVVLRNALGPLCGGGRRVFLVQWRFGPVERQQELHDAVFADFTVDSWRSFEGLELYVLSGPYP